MLELSTLLPLCGFQEVNPGYKLDSMCFYPLNHLTALISLQKLLAVIFLFLNISSVYELCSNYSPFSLLLPPFLKIPSHINGFGGFVLWTTEFRDLCDQGFETIHWNLVGSPTGTQFKAMTPLLEGFSSQQFNLERPIPHHAFLLVSLVVQLLTGNCIFCECKTSMAVSRPRWHLHTSFFLVFRLLHSSYLRFQSVS